MAGETSSTLLGGEFAKTMQAAAPYMMAFGAIQGMIGTYYSSKTQQYQLESAKLSYENQRDMSEINARMAESQAQAILLAGENQKAQVTLRAGKIKSMSKASMAARGITLGVGSAAENIATVDLMKEVDALTINYNTVRAAAAARTQKVNLENQALMYGVSASGAGMAADQINPWMSAANSLIGSATNVAASYLGTKQQRTLATAIANAGGG